MYAISHEKCNGGKISLLVILTFYFFKSVTYCTLSRRLKLHIWKEHCYCQNSQKMAILFFFRGKNCQKVLFFDNVSAFCNSFFPLLPCSF